MFQPVTLPLWSLILVLLFAAVTFLSHFLFPSVRWFFRRRMERAVAELNKRLKRPIEPFKLASRFDTIQRVTYDSAVLQAVTEHAAEEGVPEDVALQRARRYAREIVPSFSAGLYFGYATGLARWLSRKLYDVRVDEDSTEVLEGIDRGATVIFVMNHRSNMDYVLVTHLVAERSALSYAVGEWARVWPLSGLIRTMGAYFIRRRSRNALYRRVLARYVHIATRAGVTQAIFPEGGLSLDGRMAPPKLGLLSYIVAAFDRDSGRDVVFVPVALAYDRVLEDRVLTRAAASGTRRFRASVGSAVLFLLRYVWRRLRGRADRFGIAGVRFGVPLSLAEFQASRTGDPTRALGVELSERVRAALPVLPVPLVAWIVTQAAQPLHADDIVARARDLMTRNPDPLLTGQADGLVSNGILALRKRKVLIDGPNGLSPAPGQADLLDFYANAVAHRFKGLDGLSATENP